MKIIVVVVALFSVAGFGFIPSLQKHQPAPIAVVPLQSLGQPLTLVQFPAVSLGTPNTIHITIVGAGPASGTFLAPLFRRGPTEDAFVVSLRGWDGVIQGQIVASRIVVAGRPVWTGCVQIVNFGSDGRNNTGASSGHYDIAGNQFGGLITLIGSDFNCTGSSQWVGSPMFGAGAGQVVTFTVSP